ncbi:MAG: trypsin-like peptidase domain-containing protein [Acidobacteria bacterium]|nr:trypsin-like peptidase domain-containing protein [Acidobacteriota bacterium]
MRALRIFVALLSSTVVIAIATFVLMPKHSSTRGTGQKASPSEPSPTPVLEKEESPPAPPADLPTLVKSLRGDVVVIQTYDKNNALLGIGTGFFLDTRLVVTNHHVVAGAAHAEIKTKSGTARVSAAAAEDARNDLVILAIPDIRIYGHGLPLSSSAPDVGERIFVIGNPLGIEASVSDGIVAGKPPIDPFGTVIQITSPISPGSSGSPVFNSNGEVIGIATFQMVEGQNLNFAIPIEKARSLWKNSKESVEQGLAQLNTINAGLLDSMPDPFARGEFLFSMGNFDAAIPQFQEAARQNQRNGKARYMLGKCYRRTNPNAALNELKAALALSPGMVDAHSELGHVYMALHDEDNAMAEFRRALEIEPKHVGSLVGMASVHLARKEFHRAQAVLEEAVRSGDDSTAYLYLGWVYTALYREDEAFEALKKAVELNPDSIDAYKGLVTLYLGKQDPTPGMHYAQIALEKDTQDPQLHYLMGMMHLANDDPNAAARESKVLSDAYGKSSLDPSIADWRRKLESAIHAYQMRQYNRTS